jgi:dGTPase
MIDFKTKISPLRAHNSHSKTDINDPASLQRQFESDRGRIINSAAIRRLQQKTQVFPLEKNAAVRSRLTHSMEVQQVGRFIVQSIFSKLNSEQQALYGLTGLERCIESLVEMSCLMHDIGNPPFGHFGEQAINQWFTQNLPSISRSNSGADICVFEDRPELARDLQQFEGNAQAIRLIHSLLNLNLTYSQAAGILKYTRAGTVLKEQVEPNKNYLMKKVGYYFSEVNYVKELTTTLNMDAGCRHPISYIMEAADDISYCLADIEDGVEKGILSIDQLSGLLEQTYRDVLSSSFNIKEPKALSFMSETVKKAHNSSHFFISLRVSLSHPLVRHATQQFIDNIEQVYSGEYNNALLEDSSRYHAITETLKRIAIKHVFNHREVEKLELQGYRIIMGLLDCYKPLLALNTQTFSDVLAAKRNAPLLEKHLAKKLPAKHLTTYTNALNKVLEKTAPTSNEFIALEYYHRCRLVQDYISGMTDQFAYDEYRMLMVID